MLICGIMVVAAAIAAEPSALDRAYLKELAFLKAEKAELERRLESLDSDSKARFSAASAQVATLETRLSGLRRENGEMEEKLRAYAEARATADDAVEANEAIQSAREALRVVKRNPPVVGDLTKTPIDKVEAPILAIFDQLAAEVEESSKTIAEHGSFFLTDGKQVDGLVVRIGRIAAYGSSGEGSGALAEASGKLKLMAEPAADAARALAAGQVPSVLPLYLRDGSLGGDGAAVLAAKGEVKEKHNLIKTLMGLPIFEAEWVLYVLIGMSLFSVAVMIERTHFFRKHAIDVLAVRATLEEKLGRGDYDGAASFLSNYDSLETNIVLAGVREHARGADAVEDLVRGAETAEKARYSRFLGFLATVGSNSPFIGLFGTVLGIIRAFQELAATMQNAGGSVMGGISEALIATAVGLLVAIPAVIAFNTFSGKVKSIAGNGEMLARILFSNLKKGAVADGGTSQ